MKIGSYLQNIVKDAKSDDISGNGDKAYQWKNDFVSDDTKHQFAQFTFTPLTGGKFEKEQYTYANYRVRLTAVLLDKTEVNWMVRKQRIISSIPMPGSIRI